MTIRLSTGLRNELLKPAGSSFGDVMADFYVDLYSGSQPASADTAPTGTLLITYSLNGLGAAGGTWGSAAAGKVSRTTSEVLMGTAAATGTAGWGRIRLDGDLGTTNTTDNRVSFSVGTANADLNLASTSFTSGETVDILGVLSFTLPAS